MNSKDKRAFARGCISLSVFVALMVASLFAYFYAPQLLGLALTLTGVSWVISAVLLSRVRNT
jgi:hypothetical protein